MRRGLNQSFVKKGLWLAQLEDGRGAPTTKDLSALMEAGGNEMLWFEEQYCNAKV